MLGEWWVHGINPEPWRVPGVPGRGPVVKDGKLDAYQQALKEELEGNELLDGLLCVKFYFWRSTRANQPADATNLQKATEDGLEGVLYVNDKHNRLVSSMVCDQSPEIDPHILIQIARWTPDMVPVVPTQQVIGRWQDSTWQPPDDSEII